MYIDAWRSASTRTVGHVGVPTEDARRRVQHKTLDRHVSARAEALARAFVKF
jgi:hypothetical protein